jgi:transcription antitermination factor NusB
MEFNPDDPTKSFDLICDHFESPRAVRSFSIKLVQGVCEKKEEVDRLIRTASQNWRLERMPILDRSILRMAVFEMLYMADIPPKVSIDEAVELGKKYGGQDSGSFLNGVLDRVYSILLETGENKKLRPGHIRPQSGP